MTQGFLLTKREMINCQKILTKREMINCQKFNFLLFSTINSATTGVRELNRTNQMMLVTHKLKRRNARDLDEVSSGLVRMSRALVHQHLYRLAVQAGFYGDVVECLISGDVIEGLILIQRALV